MKQFKVSSLALVVTVTLIILKSKQDSNIED